MAQRMLDAALAGVDAAAAGKHTSAGEMPDHWVERYMDGVCGTRQSVVFTRPYSAGMFRAGVGDVHSLRTEHAERLRADGYVRFVDDAEARGRLRLGNKDAARRGTA